MSTEITRTDPGSRVMRTVGKDLVTAGIGGASVAAIILVPGFGWLIGGIGIGYVGVKAFLKGLSARR